MMADDQDLGSKFSRLFIEQVVDRPIDEIQRSIKTGFPSVLRDLVYHFLACGVEEDAIITLASHMSTMGAHALLDFVMWGGGDIEDTGIQYCLIARGPNDESPKDIHDIFANAQGELLEDDGWIVQYSKYSEYCMPDSWPRKV